MIFPYFILESNFMSKTKLMMVILTIGLSQNVFASSPALESFCNIVGETDGLVAESILDGKTHQQVQTLATKRRNAIVAELIKNGLNKNHAQQMGKIIQASNNETINQFFNLKIDNSGLSPDQLKKVIIDAAQQSGIKMCLHRLNK